MATEKTKTKTPAEKPKSRPKAKETQEDLDKSPSRKPITQEDDVVEHPDIAKKRAEKEAAKSEGKPVRKGPIQDEVSAFLGNTKSNDDAIRQTKKSEWFANINKKAWDGLLEQKDTLLPGLFRMRLGNMLRGSISKAKKLAEKAAAKQEKAKKAA